MVVVFSGDFNNPPIEGPKQGPRQIVDASLLDGETLRLAKETVSPLQAKHCCRALVLSLTFITICCDCEFGRPASR